MLWPRSWDAADTHDPQTKVRDVRASTMDGGGFAADGDLTLGGMWDAMDHGGI